MENVEIFAEKFERAVENMAASQTNWPSHICFVYLDSSGGVVESPASEVCYARIVKTPQLAIKKLVLFVPHCVRRDTRTINTREYLDWIINSQMFGRAFITKDVDEGLEKGFRVDTTQNRALVFGALQAFRYGFETSRFGWSAYRKMGFSVAESLALSSCFNVVDDGPQGLYLWCGTPAYYSEHFHINPRYRQFSCFLGNLVASCKAPPLSERGCYDPVEGSWFSGWSTKFWATRDRHVSLTYSKVFGVGSSQKVKLNKQNATKLLEAIKQET